MLKDRDRQNSMDCIKKLIPLGLCQIMPPRQGFSLPGKGLSKKTYPHICSGKCLSIWLTCVSFDYMYEGGYQANIEQRTQKQNSVHWSWSHEQHTVVRDTSCLLIHLQGRYSQLYISKLNECVENIRSFTVYSGVFMKCIYVSRLYKSSSEQFHGYRDCILVNIRKNHKRTG